MKSTLKIVVAVAFGVFLPTFVSAATLSVSPASQTVKVGDTFTVSVRLDTQGASIDGTDIRFLTFNPTLLQIQDGDPKNAGIQIGADSLMPLTVLNTVDNATGKITFSQVVAGGTKYKGSGILATLSFKAIAPGNASLIFSHVPNSTIDSNVASNGTDVLSAVINGSYTITGSKVGGVPQQTVTGKPTTIEEPVNSPLPAGDDTPFEYSDKMTFWQRVKAFLVSYFTGFKERVGSIFN